MDRTCAISILIAFCFSFSSAAFSNKIDIPPLQEIYEFHLDVVYRRTMTALDANETEVSYDADRQLFLDEKGRFHPADQIIVGDGGHKRVITFNGSLPGPTLVLFTGSTFVAHVRNLIDLPVSVHWHGLHTSPYVYDGVGYVNQCPIEPGGSFTYKFQVMQSGTHWYHGHIDLLRGDGMYGTMIFLEPNRLPTVSNYVAALSDWYSQEMSALVDEHDWTLGDDVHSTVDDSVEYVTRDLTGQRISEKRFYSLVVNGRGWHDARSLIPNASGAPLERFVVDVSERGQAVFRLLNAGIIYGLKVYVQDHQLELLASDGYAVKRVKIDRLVVQSGERYDVLLRPRRNVKAGESFRIFVETLEHYDEDFEHHLEFRDHFILALLTYTDGSSRFDTTDVLTDAQFSELRSKCAAPCFVANCQYDTTVAQKFANEICINIEGIDVDPSLIFPAEDTFEEHFLNFGGAELDAEFHGVNGIRNRFPKEPAFLSEDYSSTVGCDASCGHRKHCGCFRVQPFKLNNVVDLVLYNKPDERRVVHNFGHPVHLHGHHFYVLETVYPTYRLSTNGTIEKHEEAISCSKSAFKCNFATWRNPSQNRRPSLNQLRYFSDGATFPPLKDTVYVPYGGYVLIRFRANNPGWWLLHCHMLPHEMGGMMLPFRVGEGAELPALPDDLPRCTYPSSRRYIILWIFLTLCALLVVVAFAFLLTCHCKRTRQRRVVLEAEPAAATELLGSH